MFLTFGKELTTWKWSKHLQAIIYSYLKLLDRERDQGSKTDLKINMIISYV